ncbi:PH domain-containing protein [Promicromonospora thailandica]|uniref:Membrane protein n=1 Tax=Promicromonospora thailandica TaxID=765201 RepID=A0A9X2G6C7_9MICO|nr:PH domain-containing protein [Promicromonospora thailandica]MCP2266465.1 putative membrane protein [Promicromonospora thailandica]BFF20153.1 PH domain-containing protein [Promicromonospora thailandica]
MSTPDQGTPPEPAADDLEWRRVHPVTPLVRGWAVVGAALLILGQQSLEGGPRGGLLTLLTGEYWWTLLVALAAVALVGWGYSVLAWRMTTYAIGEETVHLRRGILFRQQRHARLDRLQSVDIRQPLVARFFGLCELTLETAGGTDSGIAIGFLKGSDADELRAELLARAAGLKVARPASGQVGAGAVPAEPGPLPEGTQDAVPAADAVPHPVAGTPAPVSLEAPQVPVLTVPLGRMIASVVRSGAMITLLVWALAVLGVVIGTGEFAVMSASLPAVLGAGGYLFNRITGEFDFRVAISPDGVRLRHGLLETRSQTIPPGRVQAVRLVQSVLWRGRDWWRVQVNVAGYGGDNEDKNSVLLPVGTRDEALTVLSLVLPDLGVDEPRRVLDAGLDGDSRTPSAYVTAPRRTRILDPVAWRRNGFTVTGRALLLRRGRMVKILDVVPHERTQSLGLSQGPWQRRLGVASFQVHSTEGPVHPEAPHLDADDAARLMAEQARRARTARAAAGPERWMERQGE